MSDKWGTDSPIHAIKKESSWLEFMHLVPRKDPVFEKLMLKVKQVYIVDQYLVSHDSFLKLKNDDVTLSFT